MNTIFWLIWSTARDVRAIFESRVAAEAEADRLCRHWPGDRFTVCRAWRLEGDGTPHNHERGARGDD